MRSPSSTHNEKPLQQFNTLLSFHACGFVLMGIGTKITTITVTRRSTTRYFLVAIARAVHAMFYVLWLLYGSESRSILVMYTFIYSNLYSHGYEDVTIHHRSTSKNTIRLHSEFPLYSFPHPITFSPGAAVAVAARILWVGLSCQSLRGRFSRLAFLPLELSTDTSPSEWSGIGLCNSRDVGDRLMFQFLPGFNCS